MITLIAITMLIAVGNLVLSMYRSGKPWRIQPGSERPPLSNLPLVITRRKPGDVTSVHFSINDTMLYAPGTVRPEDWSSICGERSLKTKQTNIWWLTWAYDQEYNEALIGLEFVLNGEYSSTILKAFNPTQGKPREFTLELHYERDQLEFRLRDLMTGVEKIFVKMNAPLTGLKQILGPYFPRKKESPAPMVIQYEFD